MGKTSSGQTWRCLLALGNSNQCIKVKAVMDPKSRQFCFILGFLIFSGNVVVIHSEPQSLLIVWQLFCLLSINESIKQRNTSVWRPFKSQLISISKEFQKNLIFLLSIYFFKLFNAKPCWTTQRQVMRAALRGSCSMWLTDWFSHNYLICSNSPINWNSHEPKIRF